MRTWANLTVLWLLAGPTVLAGQDNLDGRSGRSGWVLGVAVGGGLHELERDGASLGAEAGLSFPNLKLGRMVNGNTAVMLLLPGTIYSNPGDGDSARRRDRGFEAIIPSVQHWVRDRVWVLGGVGIGMDAPAFYDIDGEGERKFHFGTAAVCGAGVEILRRGRFSSDVQGRVHVGTLEIANGVRQRGYALSALLGVTAF